MGKRTSTSYIIEQSWTRSPQVWRTLAGKAIGLAFISFIAGALAAGSVTDEAKKLSDSKPLKPCSTTAPKDPK